LRAKIPRFPLCKKGGRGIEKEGQLEAMGEIKKGLKRAKKG